MELSNSPETELVNNSGTLQGQALISEEDYKSLQSEYTRNRQKRIDELAELVQLKPERLKSIDDKKLRDSVTKQVYGYENYDTFVAVEWEDGNPQGNEDDDLYVLKKKVRSLEFTSKQKELDDAIEVYKIQNPTLVKSEKDEAALREKLSFISSTIDAKERVRIAWKLAFSTDVDPTSLAYKALALSDVGVNSNSSTVTDKKKDENQEALRKFLGIKTN